MLAFTLMPDVLVQGFNQCHREVSVSHYIVVNSGEKENDQITRENNYYYRLIRFNSITNVII